MARGEERLVQAIGVTLVDDRIDLGVGDAQLAQHIQLHHTQSGEMRADHLAKVVLFDALPLHFEQKLRLGQPQGFVLLCDKLVDFGLGNGQLAFFGR